MCGFGLDISTGCLGPLCLWEGFYRRSPKISKVSLWRLDILFLPNLALAYGYLPGTTWSFLGLTNSETTLYIASNARNVALGEREELGRFLRIFGIIKLLKLFLSSYIRV